MTADRARSRSARSFVLEREQDLARGLHEVFGFFSDARNLERITPPWLHMRILTPGPLVMRAGLEIDYRIRVRGLPLRWTSAITAWDPPLRFVDEQLRGPYRSWVHEHTFEPIEGGTRVRDRVVYAVPGGALVERILVRPDLERIFDHRRAALEALLR